MKFIADVNVSRPVVERLKFAGIDVVRVPEIADPRDTDESIVALARRAGAVVITHDQDFTRILAVTGARDPSLINLRVSFVDYLRLADLLLRVIAETTADLEVGAIVTIDDGGVRVHALPIA